MDGKLDLNGISLIKNVSVLSMLFDLFPNMQESEQNYFLTNLLSLLCGQTILNKSLCCRQNVIYHLLSLFREEMSPTIACKERESF